MDYGYKKMYINGKLVDAVSGEKEPVICPGTGEVIAQIAWGGKDDAELALNAAAAAFKKWSKMSINTRKKWMDKLRDAVIEREHDIREAVMYEMGKTYNQAVEDYETVVNALEWYPQEMLHRRDEIIPDPDGTHAHQIIAQPAGVAVGYLAWNFPLLNLGFKIGPALAAGCTLILKPSANAPISAYLIGEIMESIDFPKGVVNVVAGSNEELALSLSSSKIPRVITMIGSSVSGRIAMQQAATSIKHFSMELGGNAPAIVCDDANVTQAVNDLAALKFGNCGQVCVSPNRIFVHEDVYDEFVERFVAKAKKLQLGFGTDSKIDMGPIVDERSRNRVMKLAETTLAEGAKLECGGKIPEGMEKGYFFEPTVFTNVNRNMTIFREEIFGPLAAIYKFSGDDEVLEMANDCEVGLSSYVYSNNISRIQKFSAELEVGEVHVNGFKYAIYLPHGGVKESGLGHDCSHLALDDYLEKKRITVRV
ncbi:NAD-dependent succinate-semialdehyde dehydrogenase [uncultured Draconibacterium sp.]|uniref:NAD-dependent succinate-semialdehyde dehydrogenase n=1 Tax=uncultured Draconibacterium sp. TaxID=1573823 RepID=UPI0025FC403B|nr:NAD-dependent succinate-semialdehyde dehydrogenase [uncultured Draconibacterium sp.]